MWLLSTIESVKFHVAEKRAKVKLELGKAFNEWSFDKGGEKDGHLWKRGRREEIQECGTIKSFTTPFSFFF